MDNRQKNTSAKLRTWINQEKSYFTELEEIRKSENWEVPEFARYLGVEVKHYTRYRFKMVKKRLAKLYKDNKQISCRYKEPTRDGLECPGMKTSSSKFLSEKQNKKMLHYRKLNGMPEGCLTTEFISVTDSSFERGRLGKQKGISLAKVVE